MAKISTLTALSPLDGRYAEKVAPIAEHFSEFALICERVRVEIAWLLCLSSSSEVKDCKRLSRTRATGLKRLAEDLDLRDAKRIKTIERRTRHDVKAVELFLAEHLRRQKMQEWTPWLHFGCTSEDINSVAHARMVTGALRGPMRDEWRALGKALRRLAKRTANMPMPARTHGQPASPTTMGKEMAVFAARLSAISESLEGLRMTAKFGGATGNFSAWMVACPEVDWFALTRRFLRDVAPDCDALDVTTQIDPHDSLARICLELVRLATMLTDLARDCWQYISDGHFGQRRARGQVGSSTMPHKVNPIDFENAEGNLGIATALLTHLATKLPISRLQRDLSDSTVMRNVGTAFGHLHLAMTNLQAGLGKLEPRPDAMRAAVADQWEVLAEAVQTCLRRQGETEAYEKLRRVTQGKAITEKTYRRLVGELPLPEEMKRRLESLRPEDYVGMAESLARRATKQ